MSNTQEMGLCGADTPTEVQNRDALDKLTGELLLALRASGNLNQRSANSPDAARGVAEFVRVGLANSTSDDERGMTLAVVSGMTDAAFRLYCVLLRFARRGTDGKALPSLNTLGAIVGRSPRSVSNDVCGLKAAGWIQAEARPGQPTAYTGMDRAAVDRIAAEFFTLAELAPASPRTCAEAQPAPPIDAINLAFRAALFAAARPCMRDDGRGAGFADLSSIEHLRAQGFEQDEILASIIRQAACADDVRYWSYFVKGIKQDRQHREKRAAALDEALAASRANPSEKVIAVAFPQTPEAEQRAACGRELQRKALRDKIESLPNPMAWLISAVTSGVWRPSFGPAPWQDGSLLDPALIDALQRHELTRIRMCERPIGETLKFLPAGEALQ